MAKILLIQDESALRNRLYRRLRSDHHKVIFAPSGREGFSRLQTSPPDAIILDQDIPDLDAVTLCKAIRSRERTCGIPMLFLSSGSGLSRMEAILQAGADNVLPKPFPPQALSFKLEALFRNGKRRNGLLRVPAILAEAYARLHRHCLSLGDAAEIFSGIATPDSRRSLSTTRRGPAWEPILLEKDIHPFSVDYGGTFVHYDRRKLLHVPEESLLRSAKVVLKRSAPPFTAGVDWSTFLTDISVYSIVPARGLLCQYIAAVLNSRLMDFYIRRIQPLREHPPLGTLLRPEDIESIPFVVPDLPIQRAIAEKVHEYNAVALEPGGVSSAEAIRQEINRALFEVYGFRGKEIDRLTDLNF
ncbi:MAG: response regulator [Planctomycetota bacterium]